MITRYAPSQETSKILIDKIMNDAENVEKAIQTGFANSNAENEFKN